MRPERAKALSVLLVSMLLPFQGDHQLHAITQGVATLYPGLCAFALTARRDNNPLHPGCRYALPWAMSRLPFAFPFSRRPLVQGVKTHGEGDLNEGSFPGSLASPFSSKRLRERMQSFALAVAKLCVGGCKALRWRLQCFALTDAMLCVRDGQSLHNNRQSYFG